MEEKGMWFRWGGGKKVNSCPEYIQVDGWILVNIYLKNIILTHKLTNFPALRAKNMYPPKGHSLLQNKNFQYVLLKKESDTPLPS